MEFKNRKYRNPDSRKGKRYHSRVLQKGKSLPNVQCTNGIFWPFLESSVVLLITAFFE